MQIMWYDWLMLAVIGIAAIRGAMKGLIWQVATIGAIVFCFAFSESLSLTLAPMIPLDPPLNRWVSMFLLYVGFSVLTFGAARLIREWMDKAKFTEYDRHLGLLMGIVKGGVFCMVITFFVVTLSDSMRGQIMASQSGRYAAIIMDRLHPVMPDELHDVLAPYIHNLDHDGLDLKYSHHDHDPDHDHDHHPKGDHGTGGFGSDSDPTHHDHNDILNRGAGDFGTPIDNHRIADDRHNDSSGLFQIDSDPNGSNDSTDEFLGSLPNSLDSGLRDLVFRAARNTKPQDRDELLSKLRSAVPELVGRVAREWQNGKPRASQVDTASRGTLLREISSIYTDFPDAQDTLIEDIETSLEGIPERVGMSVLKDWRSDLMAIKPDPDPETNHGTSLDARIIRHLETARVPLDSLGSRLQSRLRDVELR